MVGGTTENIRLHRNLHIRVEEETQSGLRSACIPPCDGCNTILGLFEICCGYKNIIYFPIKLFNPCLDVHILLLCCIWTEESANSCSFKTLLNYDTDGKLYYYFFVYLNFTFDINYSFYLKYISKFYSHIYDIIVLSNLSFYFREQVQFFGILLYITQTMFAYCKVSKATKTFANILAIDLIIFIFLFYNFYKKNYHKTTKPKI